MPTLRVLGEANTAQAQRQFAMLTEQVEALNREMAKTALIPSGGTPAGYTKTTAALSAASRAYNEALASSGKFRVETLKVNDVIEKQTDLLRRQKLGFRDVWGSKAARQRMQAIRKEQIAMRNMTLRAVEGTIGDGHLRAQLAIPKEVSQSWDTWRSKVGMARLELQSASRVLLNWGKNTQWAGRQLMAGITYPMAAFGAAAGVMAYQVDKQMTRIQKVYNTTHDQFSQNVEESKAAIAELAQVRVEASKTSMEAARQYGASVTDTLGVQAELAATGQKGMTLQKATTEVMKNAMLGEIDYQTATKATIALQQTMNMSSQELADTWAYMNSVENQTSLSMADFATAIPIALGPLKQMGGTVQDLGTLLTAMVSRGVQVGKAANAIKATAQRLLRPSKQVQEEFRAITGADIVDIASRNKGNILDMMKELYDVTKNLTDYDKSKAFAGLFGSYQLATMSAMVDGMGDLEQGIGQTTTAYQEGTKSAEEWGKVQRQEIKAFQDSASGQFKIAFESIKASLAEVGEPFLEVASVFLKATTQVLDMFNALPSGAKKALMVVGIFAALAGPVIMIVGLLANFIANLGLTGAAMLKLVSNFNLLNKAEWAQTKLDALYEKGLYSTTSAIELQTNELKALTAAMVAHNAEMTRFMGPAFGKQESMFLGMPGMRDPMTNKNNVAALAAEQYGVLYNPNTKRYHEPNAQTGAAGKMLKTAEAQTRMRQAEMVYAEQIAASQGMATRSAYENMQTQEKTQRVLKGSNVMMGAMAASTTAMMVSSNETVDSIAQWGLMLSIGVPAVQGLAGGFGKVATKAKDAYAVQKAANAANLANYGTTSRLAMATGKAGAAMSGMRAAAVGLMGPLGWAVTAVTTVGVLAYKWWQHEKKVREEREAQANAMYDQNALLQDQLKIQEKQRKTLSITGQAYGREGLPNASDLAADMKGSDTYKPLIDDLKSDDTMQVEKDAIAMQKYKDVLEATGGSAEKARLYLEAMFVAAGDGALEAERKARDYANQIGTSFSDSNMLDLWRKQMLSIGNDNDTKNIEEQGKNLGKSLATAIAEGGHDQANNNLSRFVDVYKEQLPNVFDELNANTKTALESYGITNFETLQNVYDKYMDAGTDNERMQVLRDELDVTGQSLAQAGQLMDSLSGPMDKNYALQRGVVKELAAQLGIEQEITTFKQLQATWEWQLATATEKNAVMLYKQRQAYLDMIPFVSNMSDDERLRLANQVRLNAGMDELTSIYQVNAWLAGKLTTETKATAGAVEQVKNAWAGVNFGGEMSNILKSGMEGLQSDLADAASDSLDSRMNASLESAQAAWEERIDNMQKSHEAAMDRFDKKWERRKEKVTAAYDAQIAGIDKAIEREQRADEIRQKIFDAEMTRIERMKDIANAGIDYNMALRTGNIDEAAKISNDMTAQAQEWALSDANDAAGSASERRMDRLGKQQDKLEELKDDRLEAMEEEEAKQREHLEKMQQAQEDALQKQSDASLEALRANWEAEKDNLNDRLKLFQAYTAMNKKDLDRWLAEVGLSYDDFGGSVMLKGETWSGAIEKSLKKHIREAGLAVANDQMWANLGNKQAKQTLMGMGFKGMGQFRKFIMTGEIPEGFGKNRKNNDGGTMPVSNHPNGTQQVLHSGGMVGSGISSRTGVARTHGGLHNSEVMVQALSGEMMMNRDAASKYGSILNAMNKGRFEGGAVGPAGLVAGMAGRGFAAGVGKSLESAVARKTATTVAQAVQTVLGGGFVMGGGGMHQPSVPGNGWFNSHDYSNPVGTPLYAFNDATVVQSRAITSGGSPGNGVFTDPATGRGYTSYGEMIELRDAAGNSVIYAHMSPGKRFVKAGDTVKGGSLIGLSGWTGNATGPHTHFTVNGSYAAEEWFNAHHIGLKKGGYTKKDTPATVHKNEMVIDSKRTKKLYGLVDNFTGLDGMWTWLSGQQKIGPNGMPIGERPTAAAQAAAAGSGKGETVRTGTYNVKFDSPNSTTQQDLTKLMGLTDILALTEWSENKRPLNKWIQSKGWGIFDPGPARNDSAVAYNAAKWGMVSSAVQQMNTLMGVGVSGARGVGGAGAMYATGALLKSKTGGASLWQIAAHTIAHLWKAGVNRQVQQQQFGALGSMATRLGGNGKYPVFVGGDLNNDPRSMGAGHGAQGAKWFAPLVAAGLKDNWNKDTMNGNVTMGDRYIDHMFSNSLAKFMNQRVIGGLGSDHRAVLTEFSIPQLAKGAQNIRWDNTLANLHKGEAVLTADMNKDYREGMRNFANGGDAQYNTNVYVTTNASAEEIARAVDKVHRRQENRRPQRKTNRVKV